MLITADVLALVAVALAFGPGRAHSQFGTVGYLLILTIGGLLAAALLGAYGRDQRTLRPLTADELPAQIVWAIVVGAIELLVRHANGDNLPSTMAVAGLIAALVVGDGITRAAARSLWRRVTPPERVIVVGSVSTGRSFDRKVALYPELHAEVVATISSDHLFESSERRASELIEVARGYLEAGADRLLLDDRILSEEVFTAAAALCREHNMKLGVLPTPVTVFGPCAWLDRVAEIPVIHCPVAIASPTSQVAKRTLDVTVSALALLLLAPLFAIVAVAVRLDSRGPAIFRQRRAGQNGVPITVLKFRTMVNDAEARLSEFVDIDALIHPMFKLTADPRVTRVGRILRRTSIDELPQLVNVFRGDMSLVGIRPEQLDLVARYSSDARAIRLATRPGLTGPMQVLGRGELTFEERLAVERDYVENQSFSRDLKILVLTCGVVLFGRGAR
jgi:exopolysaccharide biosynthesis polyprenyl glycosylphosphotransferase